MCFLKTVSPTLMSNVLTPFAFLLWYCFFCFSWAISILLRTYNNEYVTKHVINPVSGNAPRCPLLYYFTLTPDDFTRQGRVLPLNGLSLNHTRKNEVNIFNEPTPCWLHLVVTCIKLATKIVVCVPGLLSPHSIKNKLVNIAIAKFP
jgi:hypothetical protein